MKLGFKLFLIIIFLFAGIYSLRHLKRFDNDYIAYYLAGERIVAKTLGKDIVQSESLTSNGLFKSSDSLYQNGDVRPFKYNPTIAYMFAPFSVLSYKYSQYAWYWFCFLLLVFSLYLIYQQFDFSDGKKTFWFFLLLFIVQLRFYLMDMKVLQVNFIILFCTVGFLVWRKSRPWVASTLLAFMVGIKIFPVILLIFFLVEKDYKMLGRIMVMGLLLILLPVFSYGTDLYGEYLNYLNFMTNGQHDFPAPANFTHPSLDSFIVRYFMDRTYHGDHKINFFSWDPQSTFYLISFLKIFLLGMIVLAQRRLKDYWAKFALYLNYIIVINPLAWKHALVALTITWVVLGRDFMKNKWTRSEKVLLGISLILLVTSTHMFWGELQRSLLGGIGHDFLGILILSILLWGVSKKNLVLSK